MYEAGAAAAAAAAVAAAAQNISPGVEQADSAPNPSIPFTSQTTQQVTVQTSNDWRTHPHLMAHAGNPWQDWTAAIADSQDRYSANALLPLGSERPGDVGSAAVANHINQADVMAVAGMASTHTDQWPLLLFHDVSVLPSGSGGDGGGG
jgi:hypothetical protein